LKITKEGWRQVHAARGYVCKTWQRARSPSS